MERTTISLPSGLIQQLRLMAAARRTSMAAIIREAIEEKAAKEPAERRPKPRSIGIGASGYTDTAIRSADERPVPRSWR